ncbi:MAG: hypothetical protein GY716_16280 [bacterium]|nr:hypothetical protein [bacterium]
MHLVPAKRRRARLVAPWIVVALIAPSWAGEDEKDCVGFEPLYVDLGGVNGATDAYAADLNGDGHVDVVTASFVDDRVSWWENDGQSPPTFTEHVIATFVDSASSVHVVDLDQDGHLDVLSSSRNDNSVRWFRNDGVEPRPNFLLRAVTREAEIAEDVYAADLDDDSDIDVLSASFLDNKISWYEYDETDGEVTFTEHVISTEAQRAKSVFAADLDGDMDMDVLSASVFDNKISWYENEPSVEEGEAPRTFTEHVISINAMGAQAVTAGDVDGDGDIDVLSASLEDDKIAWYENEPAVEQGDAPRMFTEHPIATDALRASDVMLVDLDGDDRPDVLASSSEDGTVAWYRNDGTDVTPPTFAVREVISDTATGAAAVHAADLDGDKLNDPLYAGSVPDTPSAASNRVAWFPLDPGGGFVAEGAEISGATKGSEATVVIDLDADGDDDVVFAGPGDRLGWYESDGGDPPAFTERTIDASVPGASSLIVIDLDADDPDADGPLTDLDLVVTSADDDSVRWFENDGSQNFTEHLVFDEAVGASDVAVAQLYDDDDDLDLAVVSAGDDTVRWFENDGEQSFTDHLVFEGAVEASAVDVGNLSLDGKPDIVVSSAGDSTIRWFQHQDEPEDPDEVFAERLISLVAIGAADVIAVDLDADGDDDLAAASTLSNRVSWFENVEDIGDPENPLQRVFIENILSVVALAAVQVDSGDVNGDGNLDLLSAAFGDDELAWYENDGDLPPGFVRHVVPTTSSGLRSVDIGQIDADEEVEIVTGSISNVAWYDRAEEICAGFDASGDGLIGNLELIYVGRAFGLSSDVQEWWTDVDFDRNGRIDGDDLVILAGPGVWQQSTDDCTYICQ